MTDKETLEKVREFFKGDRYAAETGAVIDEIGEHYAKCSLVINDTHRNAMGGVMGGVYFTLADFTFAVATNWQTPGIVGLNGSISFIGVPKSDKMIAEAHFVKESKHIATYTVEIKDDLGNVVAQVQFLGYRVK
jgi:acyl-CoA thioesterase